MESSLLMMVKKAKLFMYLKFVVCEPIFMLRQFDMNMAYGPCVGMTRVDRWERALRLGMNPPTEIERLLKTEKVQQDCLWQGRV